MLNATQTQELFLVAQRGAESAGEALSQFVRRRIDVRVREVCSAPLERIPEQLGGGEQLAVGLLSRVRGEMEGNSLLLLGRDDALTLVHLLGGAREGGACEGFGDLERSMLLETANIAITSFMNSLAVHLGLACVPNAPVYLLDLAGAILSVILMENAAVADEALLILTAFTCEGEDLTALFAFLPGPDSLESMQRGLNGD
jgi:chemotaxis protein CheC